jgi:hypothetical protein
VHHQPFPTPARAARIFLSPGSLTLAAAFTLSLAACGDSTPDTTAARAPTDAAALNKGGNQDDRGERAEFRHAQVKYGRPMRVGNGLARTYVVLAEGRDRRPLEVGVALDEKTMEGLAAPAAMKMDGRTPGGLMAHGSMTVFNLPLPEKHGTPFQFVELDWNPAGHEPPGIYDIPHFDFHFYTITQAARDAIDPARPAYGDEAANLPPAQFRFPYYVDAATAAGGIPAALAAVPRMGLHWLDVRSPELQGALGNPAGYRPFTKTFIYGSWNGQVTFAEPMITRAYIMAKRGATDAAVRNEVTPVSTAGDYQISGYYPSAYRIAYDRRAKEYRVALTQLGWRD